MGYSNGTGIELIEPGTQAGTWGGTTNDNFKKIDQSFTQYAEVPVTTTSGWVANTLTWTLDDSVGALAEGSQGRAPFVEFSKGTGSLPSDFKVVIRGETLTGPPRLFYARNATAKTISFYVDSSITDANCFELYSGETALLITYLDAVTTDSYVWNALSELTTNEISLQPRSKGIHSGTPPTFLLDGNSPTNYFGNDTVAIGKGAGNPANGTTTQINNVIIGSEAAAAAAGMVRSVVIGQQAGTALTSGDDNVIIGRQAGYSLTAEPDNVFIGMQAGYYVQGAGTGNVFVGKEAGKGTASSNTGNYNVGIGLNALDAIQSGDDNICIGNDAGGATTTGSRNVFVGDNAGPANTIGFNNVGVGPDAGEHIVDGDFNVCIGTDAGKGCASGDHNVFIGRYAGQTGSDTVGDEKLIINSSVSALTAPSYEALIYGDFNTDTVKLNATGSASTNSGLYIQNTNTAAATFDFIKCYSASGGTPDLKYKITGEGNVSADGTFTPGGADYADMFEWSDGNPDAEDRVGLSVVLEGEGGIRPATTNDVTDDIVGVVSGTASVVGGASWSNWDKTFLKDDFGRPTDEPNPDFDESLTYVPRQERPEWAVVGLTGRIHIRKGSPTHPSWRKIRDVSAVTEEWLVR